MPVPPSLPGLELWRGLKSIGRVESQCVRDGKETVEVRYYISSLGVSVKRFAHAVRSHWSMESCLTQVKTSGLPRHTYSDGCNVLVSK